MTINVKQQKNTRKAEIEVNILIYTKVLFVQLIAINSYLKVKITMNE